MADASAQHASVTALVTAAGKLVKVETDAIRASSGGGDGGEEAAPKHADRIDRILQKLVQLAQQPSAQPMPAQQAEQALQP